MGESKGESLEGEKKKNRWERRGFDPMVKISLGSIKEIKSVGRSSGSSSSCCYYLELGYIPWI